MLQVSAGMLADDPLTGELLPPGVRLPVIHNQVRVAKVTRYAEFKHFAVQSPVKRDRRVAQWAEGDRYRHTTDAIIHYFVPGQNLERVGTSIAVYI